jgi:uncharacterized protein
MGDGTEALYGPDVSVRRRRRAAFSRFELVVNIKSAIYPESRMTERIQIPMSRSFNNRESAMKCPIDGAELVISDRSGVEIDYCPNCRGVWLDRGELDKIIERSSSFGTQPPPVQDSRSRDQGYHKKKKRGGFLEDLFDF